ncbi:hypothetical protein WISP_37280 [Willisornis vidua]|uniref:Uncharacterized protein n=1 Tax=Willisornis vidua TaxID=1566151 RepID=A0ABQ9DIR4_9PASS|nr:hypothetical protein WISP_37280 [Willisornis vidua]
MEDGRVGGIDQSCSLMAYPQGNSHDLEKCRQNFPRHEEEDCEEIPPDVQSEPLLAQLKAISSCPGADHLGEEPDPPLATTSSQVVVESEKVIPEPPFVQTWRDL